VHERYRRQTDRQADGRWHIANAKKPKMAITKRFYLTCHHFNRSPQYHTSTQRTRKCWVSLAHMASGHIELFGRVARRAEPLRRSRKMSSSSAAHRSSPDYAVAWKGEIIKLRLINAYRFYTVGPKNVPIYIQYDCNSG